MRLTNETDAALLAIAENRLLSRWATLLPRVSGAVHEADAELLSLPGLGTLALTVDTVVEEIALGLYREGRTAGRVAALASVSDLAAVGADPLGLLLSVTLPVHQTEQFQRDVAQGVAEVCREAGTGVLGGDTNLGVRLSVGTTGVGLVPEGVLPLRRVGIRPGDHIFASGPLGLGGALAAAHWICPDSGLLSEDDFRPRVRLPFGRALRGIASACMDTSDGLVATLDQLARLNGVGLSVEGPLFELLCPLAREVCLGLDLPPFALLAALHGEFELVFAVPESCLDLFEGTNLPALYLGRAFAGRGLRLGGRLVDGARVRNLMEDLHGDVRSAAEALVALDPEREVVS